MATAKVAEQAQPLVMGMASKELIRLALAGGLTGLIASILYIIFDRFILSDTFCSTVGAATAGCASKTGYVAAFAIVFANLAGLFTLVSQRIYRPLLVVLFTVASLWGVMQVVVTLPLVQMIIVNILLFGVAYAAFGWLARVRNFFVALVVGLIALIVLRLLFVA